MILPPPLKKPTLRRRYRRYFSSPRLEFIRLNSLIVLARSNTSRKTFELSKNYIKSSSYRTILNRRRSLFISPGIIVFGVTF